MHHLANFNGKNCIILRIQTNYFCIIFHIYQVYRRITFVIQPREKARCSS